MLGNNWEKANCYQLNEGKSDYSLSRMHNSGSNFMKSGFTSIVPEVTTPFWVSGILGVSNACHNHWGLHPVLQSSCF
ncbi:hypothetical protein ACRRTK_004220 [Alexandromys fortis]